MPSRRTLPAVVAAVTLGACSFAPPADPPAPLERLPDSWATPVADSGSYAPRQWWASWDDPTLERLVDTVLAANLDLVEAVARVDEARALVGVSAADLLPSLGGSADVTRSDNPNNAGFGRQIFALLGGASGDTTGEAPDSAPPPPDRFRNTTYSTALTLSYELDFWGRARNDRAAAVRDLEASDADLQTAVLGVLSESISAYFEVADLRRRVDLTAEIVDVLRERVALTETRYDRGLVSSFELYQVRQDLRNTEAGLPQLRALLDDATGRLAVLAGRYPSEIAPLLEGPDLPDTALPPIPAALPADLLWQRPDVRAAGRRLEAARLRVGARRAELLPSLNLTGTLGLQSAEADGLLDLSQWFSNLTAGLTAPLFQGGRLRANVRAQEARWAQQRAAYGRLVLTAVAEVESALARHREEALRFAFLRAQLDEAEASVDLQSRRYASGVSGYADYLDALRTRLTVQSTLAAAARDYALARLGVHRALGGGWIDDPTDHSAPEGAARP